MYELIKEFCENEGLDFYDGYSGRGMFGMTCAGIICDEPLTVLVRLCSYIAGIGSNAEEEMLKLGNPRLDSMGIQSIVYFPSVVEE